jgi:preprotein translocase subunit YajC
LAPLLLAILFIAVGYVLILKPQKDRLRAQQAMVQALQVGDRVVTAGGIHGTLTAVDDEIVRVEVADGVVLTLARPAIGRRLDDDADPPHPGPDEAEPTEHPAPGTTGGPAEDIVTTYDDDSTGNGGTA